MDLLNSTFDKAPQPLVDAYRSIIPGQAETALGDMVEKLQSYVDTWNALRNYDAYANLSIDGRGKNMGFVTAEQIAKKHAAKEQEIIEEMRNFLSSIAGNVRAYDSFVSLAQKAQDEAQKGREARAKADAAKANYESQNISAEQIRASLPEKTKELVDSVKKAEQFVTYVDSDRLRSDSVTQQIDKGITNLGDSYSGKTKALYGKLAKEHIGLIGDAFGVVTSYAQECLDGKEPENTTKFEVAMYVLKDFKLVDFLGNDDIFESGVRMGGGSTLMSDIYQAMHTMSSYLRGEPISRGSVDKLATNLTLTDSSSSNHYYMTYNPLANNMVGKVLYKICADTATQTQVKQSGRGK